MTEYKLVVGNRPTENNCERCYKVPLHMPKCVNCGVNSHQSCATGFKFPVMNDNMINCCSGREECDEGELSFSSGIGLENIF